ncbi:MAG: hypothetical protein KF729_35765 [Sandaracinaceae bacterium]|nr:hypothetical protein [Sandaracinaceae bacterium]
MSALVLVLDAGMGGGRAAIYDERGEALALAARPWRPFAPRALAPFGREYDAGALADALDAATLEALAAVDADAIEAIACTGQRIACAFLDEAGEVVYAGPNGDVRALAAGGVELGDDDEDYARTGRFPAWIHAPARLAWFREHRPGDFARVARVVGLPGWAAHRLTGCAALDRTIAADLAMLDVARGERLAACPAPRWPPLAAPTAILGELSSVAAARLGLRAGLPVAVGCADTQAALLFGGEDTLVAGSSAPLVRACATPARDPARRLWLDPDLRAGGFALEANLGEMGAAHAWLREMLDLPTFDAFDALARTAPAGARGASAHLGPRAMDLRALNASRPAGLLFPFGETSGGDAPRRADLARSFLESCAFAARAGRAWLDAALPAPPALSLLGGMSRSRVLADALATTLGVPVLAGPADATARGAAACALVAARLASDLEDARERLRVEPARHEPSPHDRDALEDAFERWQEREAALEEM